MVTVALRSSYVIFGAQLTDTVIAPSDAEPDDGDTETHESEVIMLQSRFAENEIEELLPSAFNSILSGPVYVNSGALWQDQIVQTTQRKNEIT